jgi:predicted PurR-regulated permease PerM
VGFKINIWRVLGIIAVVAFALFFFKIVIYLTISLVLFLIAYPVTYQIQKIRIGKNRRVPEAIASLLTIFLILFLTIAIFFIVIPPVINQIRFLSGLNFYEVLHNILIQFPGLENTLLKFGSTEDLKQGLSREINAYLNPANIGIALNNTVSYFGTLIGGTLCVLFITFFLLKDENIVKQSLLTISPVGIENEMRHVLHRSKKMLSRYFAGLFTDMFLVGITALIVLTVLGVQNAVIIAFIAGLLNVIPYIGSFITMILAIFLGVSGCISAGTYELIGPTINKIFFTLLSINLIDGFVVQPFIFSNTVKAHPLEIFIVTLMAGTIGGIFGMVIALPTYTLLRIIASEFFKHVKFFRKISANLDK